ncbi:unnamed protein product [Callosobruchus maculatus]|uniref:Cell cycle checkpoint control protein n=1 Tax=Callosobruchus maculatus TaxID=64391 RepID=A0A653C971_CALMS|nr:unnamed protein product [Callosobruchus maculatus]
MNCIIPGQNIKILSKALHALAKVGDELFIEARSEKVVLISLNLRKTVCVKYYFLDSFFSSYVVDDNALNDQNEAVTCKIHMKTILPLFKGIHLDKKLDYIKLLYEANSDKITLKMKYKCDDIVMIHNLNLMDPAMLTIDVQPDSGCNNILTTSTCYTQLLGMFSTTDDEITLEISKNKMVARNYCTGAPVKPKHVRSQVNFNGSEFSIFQINAETTVNFSLKPFRTAIQFAEGLSMNIGLNFDKGGRPLAIIMKNPTFEVLFIVATLNPYSDLHSTMSTGSIPAKITQLNGEQLNLSQEDRDALMNENWDDFDVEERNSTKGKSRKRNNKFMDIVEKAKSKSNPSSREVSRGGNEENHPEAPRMEVDEVMEASQRSLSPVAKKAKLVFRRCLEATFRPNCLGDVIAPNSDSESE